MKEYNLYFEAGAGLGIKVAANNLAEAIEEAYQELPSGVCAQCGGWGEIWGMDIGEWELNEEEAWRDYPGEDLYPDE